MRYITRGREHPQIGVEVFYLHIICIYLVYIYILPVLHKHCMYLLYIHITLGVLPARYVMYITVTFTFSRRFLSRATYSKYRDITPEASRVKCLAQGHNVI